MTERGCKIQAYALCAYRTLEQLGKNLLQATHTMTWDFSLHGLVPRTVGHWTGLVPRTVGHWTAPLCHLYDKPGRPNDNQSTNLSINQSINRSLIDWSPTAVCLHGLVPRTAPLCHLYDTPGRPNNNQSTNLSINQSPIDRSLTAVCPRLVPQSVRQIWLLTDLRWQNVDYLCLH